MSGVNKLAADRNQRVLLELVSRPGNDICADCKARTPRWASHNLGIFLCMNCASIHRKIGTHITKVKSVTMDSWSKEQVEVMKSIGNIASNAKYNPDESRHPPPANREESERDSELEKFIRWKYEFKRFMAKPTGDATPAAKSIQRSRSTLVPVASVARRHSPLPPLPPSSPVSLPSSARPPEIRPAPTLALTQTAMPEAAPSQQLSPSTSTSVPSFTTPPTAPQPAPPPIPSHPVWNDMMSLATPNQPSSSITPSFQLQGQFQQQPSFASPSGPQSFGMTPPVNPFNSTLAHQHLNRSTSLPPNAMGTSYQTQGSQIQISMRSPYPQQPTGFPGQISTSHSPFQPTPNLPISVPFDQNSSAPLMHSYTPPSAFPQQSLQQQFAPSSFPQQQLVQSMQQPLQGFPPQSHLQPANPFLTTPQWQQQPSGYAGQPQYSQWGSM